MINRQAIPHLLLEKAASFNPSHPSFHHLHQNHLVQRQDPHSHPLTPLDHHFNFSFTHLLHRFLSLNLLH